MSKRSTHFGLLLLFSWATIPAAHAPKPLPADHWQQAGSQDAGKKSRRSAGEPTQLDKNKGAAEEVRSGRQILWQEPTDIESRDLFYGPGGAEGAPDPTGRFTFISRSTTGSQLKIIVDDDKGRKWTVKFGPEAKPETAATRIVWAAGYHVDQDYFVKRARVEGWKSPEVVDVRFERRDHGFKEIGDWSWAANPFSGTRELEGLKVLMALTSNWDLKDSNNKTVQTEQSRAEVPDGQIYYVADLGATFGSTGSFWRLFRFFDDPPAGSKGHPEAYSKQGFIQGVRNGEVVFNYKGKNSAALKGIKVENARWMGDLLGRLSEKQISDAFRAGGFSDSEVATYVRAVRSRIRQLQQLGQRSSVIGNSHRSTVIGHRSSVNGHRSSVIGQ